LVSMVWPTSNKDIAAARYNAHGNMHLLH